MDSDVVVDLPTVIVEFNAVGSRVRTLARADQELRIGVPLSDDCVTIGHNAIFKPGHFWGRRALQIQETSSNALCCAIIQSTPTEPSLNISFN